MDELDSFQQVNQFWEQSQSNAHECHSQFRVLHEICFFIIEKLFPQRWMGKAKEFLYIFKTEMSMVSPWNIISRVEISKRSLTTHLANCLEEICD